MALTPDQNAALQLILERGQSYADLARVLGVEESEIRERARSALRELAGADPDRKVPLTDYLLGQADPIGRADAVRHLRDDAEDRDLAAGLLLTLRTSYPDAELPRLPGEAKPPKEDGSGLSLPSLSTRQSRLAALLGTGAVVLIVLVLAIAGVFSGDDESSGGSDGTTTAQEETGEELERIPLTSPSGDATGEAVFGLTDDDQAYVDLSIEGLDPAPRDRTYVVWLLLNRKQGYPLTPLVVSADGNFQERFAIPAAVLPIVARVRFVDISIAPVKTVRNTVRNALRNEQLVLTKPGDTVLTGKVPRLQQGGGNGSGDSAE